MKISTLERCVVNNPMRRYVQEHLEVPQLIHLGGVPRLGRMLEVGSGSGYGVKMILKHFNASFVDGVDVDEHMVRESRHTLSHEILEGRAEVYLAESDHFKLPAKDYEAAFFFGSLHHILDWQSAVDTVKKGLKKNGKAYFWEFYKPFITNKIVNFLASHPQQNRFTHEDLKLYLEKNNWRIVGEKNFFGLAGFVVAEKVG